ncbi:fasciclin domain-containing protein [Maritimibacter dapengensis]|uniref:Fasciclin domain-containing protein n=1 Tax=Maritimibacter dapengensis TaxID=2836868 RepID=A0ABS6T0A6_9RHOB|nr:fasciclin domain-containing protein [Maritimibacter dapengensis]MBV7378673.1 fasciclin domain-containing protein [Maritimibacter dapengensis]
MKFFTATALAATLAASTASAETIAEIAAGNDDFSTLVAAADAAGLVETLGSEGPFTVFAPTNAAFEALPEGTVESLLMEENKDQLTQILLYHVVPGEVPSSAIEMGTMGADTAAELQVCVTKSESGVMLEDGAGGMANVVTPDIEADNGVIHVIDAVIMPGEGASC